jgi:hypothetical protein
MQKKAVREEDDGYMEENEDDDDNEEETFAERDEDFKGRLVGDINLKGG